MEDWNAHILLKVSLPMTEEGKGSACLGLDLRVCEESLIKHPKNVQKSQTEIPKIHSLF